MHKAITRSILAAMLLCTATTPKAAPIVTYNFSGSISLADDYFGGVLVGNRAVALGDRYNAIYTVDAGADSYSGAFSPVSEFRNSYYREAIIKFALYIEGVEFVNDDYRLQDLKVISGARNTRHTDWLEFDLEGGIDNYNDRYGENAYGEFIDSFLEIVDFTGTALNDYNLFSGSDNIPLKLDLTDFTQGYMRAVGYNSQEIGIYQLRGNVDAIRSDSQLSITVSVACTGQLYYLRG